MVHRRKSGATFGELKATSGDVNAVTCCSRNKIIIMLRRLGRRRPSALCVSPHAICGRRQRISRAAVAQPRLWVRVRMWRGLVQVISGGVFDVRGGFPSVTLSGCLLTEGRWCVLFIESTF